MARPLRSTSSTAAWVLLTVGACGVLGVLPAGGTSFHDGLLGTLLYLAVAALGTGMAVAGAWTAPPARRRIWVAIAVGQALYLGGDVLWVLFDRVLHIAPYPSAADASYLLRYVAIAVGLGWLIRGRQQGRDRAALLDAAIISTAFTVLAVVYLVIPAAQGGGESLLSKVVAGAYPTGDVLLLAMLVRLLSSRASRSLAFCSLVLSLLVLLATDVVYTLTIVGGSGSPRWLDLPYLSTYLLMGFCAMHASSATLAEPVPGTTERLTPLRVALLGAASLLAPALLLLNAVRGSSLHPYVTGLGGIAGSALVLVRLVDLLRHAEAQAVQLSALARNDGLTGLPNRRTWDHELSRACAHARDTGTPLTVGLIDLDQFKAYNDTHGHLLGDLVLKESAAAWRESLADRGVLARYGGEEFAVAVPGPVEAAVVLLERMSRVVSGGQTCSVGLASWDGTEEPSAAMARADQALYHAKDTGRDRVAVHDGTTPRTTQPVELSLPAPASRPVPERPRLLHRT
jgi:diguanylate cyclase (GGDEF)-like protein